ncbi:MAG: class I SAM-dependent methyltransferase [SAR202 cluster bacterium]|nr:class I SAM-dependent methyltransferase [SAR202 cluster bacterium]
MQSHRKGGRRDPRQHEGARRDEWRGREASATAWSGDVARWYDALVGAKGSEYQQELVLPGVLRLLDLKKGERLLDLACGQGAFCRMAACLGVEVTGLDASRDLIEAARKHPGPRIRYLVGDARSPDVLKGEAFDAIACILAIQNIEPIGPVFANCARLLRPGGRLALAMTHPAFRIPRQSGWDWDEGRKLLYRRVDSYLTPARIPITTHPGKTSGPVTWTFHRPLQEYVRAMAKAGLAVTALEEWASHKESQPGPRAKAEDRARLEIPLFLAIVSRKLDKAP